MPEISAKELNTRLRKRFENASVALDRENFEYTVEICSDILKTEPGCLEVRKLLRRAQQSIYANGRSLGRKILGSVEAWLMIAYGQPYVKKDPKKAMVFGERSLNRNPFSARALSLVAAGGQELELHETVVYCLKSVAESGSGDAALMQRYCEALINVGETAQAIGIAERLAKLKPESGSIQELVKSASVAHSINRGRWDENEGDFRSKLKDSEETDALERITHLDVDAESRVIKARDLIEMIHHDPQDVDLYKRLAKTLIANEDYRGALDWVSKAFKLPHADSDLTLRQMRNEIAIKLKEAELEKAQVAETEGENSECIQKLQNELDALKLEEARKMVEQFPNDFGQRMKFGELLLEAGNIDEAIQQFQVSQRSSNLRLRSHVLLGRSFMKKKLFDLALEQLEIAIKASGAMDNFKKQVVYLSAECCEELGRHEEAITKYKLIYANDIGFRDVALKIDSYYSE